MTVRRDFLVEIGTEELPPKSLLVLASAFAEGVGKGLDDAGLTHGTVESFATPRRLAVRVRRLVERQPDRAIEKRGPPVKAAFDAAGAPTAAALAFARGCGVAVDVLERTETPKGAWLVHRGVEAGAGSPELLPRIVESALAALPIARRMRWGAGDAEFVRPVHWVVMLYGKDVVEATVLGVRAGNLTYGHRFMAPKPIRLTSPAVYVLALERRRVLADVRTRRETVRQGVVAAAAAAGGVAVIDPALLDEVTALVEWPVALTGHFDRRYLELPREVPIATMQDHQRYFPITDASARLLPAFVAVANVESPEPALVVAGNERVIRPRLADAEFFWQTDRKQPLAARIETLRRVTYQQQLGSLHDKSERVRALASAIGREIGAEVPLVERAAELAKCDLVTAMVGEFPELQGVMGRYYADADGEPRDVCAALEEQYWPRYAGDALPATRTGMALSLADRLDTLAGIFAIGQKPSGTRDPFGLRRAALGIMRIAIERSVDIDLRTLVEQALDATRNDVSRIASERSQPTPALGDRAALIEEVYEYLFERLRGYYLEGDHGSTRPTMTTEMFEAVLNTRPRSPLDFDARLKALIEFLTLPDASSLAAANKRIANILRKTSEPVPARVDAALLRDPAEQRLGEELLAIAREVEPRLESRDYTQAMQRLATLRPGVDGFFDSVLVMADEPQIRGNRLALLSQIRELFMRVADLSRLPGQTAA
jgi:glycyl-tRNA synthetase beta chain